MMEALVRNRECRDNCTETTGGGIFPKLCPHGRLWKCYATISWPNRTANTHYWTRIPRRWHPITYLRLRRKQ